MLPLGRAPPPVRLAFLVWGLGASLYLIGFFQRVAPAVMTRELSAEFALTAASLGNLSAVYFYSYVAMQIPTGILVDRWGPRRVIAAGAAIAAAGTFLFAASSAYGLVALGRLLIGASVGVAFVAMLKLSTHWFHPSRFAAVAGLALAAGVIGAVSAGAPLRLAVDAFGWRAVIAAAGVVTVLLAVAAWVLIRDDPTERGYASYMPPAHPSAPKHSVLGGMRAVLRSRNVWLIFVVNGGMSGPPLTFSGLWGVPFLTTHHGLTTTQAAGVASVLLVAWACAGPFVGILSDRMHRRKPLYVAGAVIAAIGWFAVLLVRDLPTPALIALLVMTGAASSAVMVGFAYAKESAPASLAGSTSGVINMGNMLGGMIMQPAVGWVLDRYWDGAMAGGARVYAFEAYRAGFSLMLAWLVVAVVLALLTRETRCRQRQS
jgi:sugar phosphate permease